MSPLEAVWRLMHALDEGGPRGSCELPYSMSWCAICNTEISGHEPDCPWLVMPRVVAALEAAERVVQAHEDPANDLGDGAGWIPSKLIDTLVTALKGD